VRHAIKAEKIGCDVVSIDGFEAAGHPGEDDVTSLILIPLTRNAISIPIIASGGFADGRGLVGALGLGADGMNMGTRFVATQEAPVHENVKQALINHGERDTRLIMRTLRNTERVMHNSVVDTVLEIESKGDTKIEDVAPHVSGLAGKDMLDLGTYPGLRAKTCWILGIWKKASWLPDKAWVLYMTFPVARNCWIASWRRPKR
jgi:nitronate monooxygenase